jgi:hypothetical protein
MFMLIWAQKRWEWLTLVLTLLLLTLFITGHDAFGLNSPLAALMALLGTLLGTILSFVIATLIVPLVVLVTGAVTALLAAVSALLAILVGGLFTPLAALLVGWVSTLFTWLAGTWLGTLLMPLYSTVTPLLIKVAPWLTASKYGHKIYDWLDDQPWWPQALVLTPKKSSRTKHRRRGPKPRRN